MRRVSEPFRPDRPSVAELAAGAVVANEAQGALLLLHHAVEDRWCFPKGHVDAGESLVEGAIREITEEAGLKELTLVEELGEVAYRFYDPGRERNVFKTTVYFLAFSPDEHVHLEPTFDSAQWLPPREAYSWVSYDTDRRMIEAAASRLALRTSSHAHYG